MKTLFVALSSSYVHTLLAPRYLAANSPLPVEIYETNVNVNIGKTLAYIINSAPDVLAFSCYIFNISYIKKLLPEIRKSLPMTKIVLGGYEAEADDGSLIGKSDFILRGEGDFAFGQLLEKINNSSVSSPLIIDSGTVKDLNSIKSPYTDEYLSLARENKIIYMETCRGCPFSCSYCMSGKSSEVRSFSLDRIFSDFDKIMSFSPRLIKLVDRTFNYDKKRAATIFSYLIEKYGSSGTRFHFEMSPELFDEELFSVTERAPKGLFQFETGIQSYKKETLDGVNRHTNNDIADENISRLIKSGNVHVHADLIAGLPYESKAEFLKGFDRLFNLKPDCLQAGFLKILKGSPLSFSCDGYTVNECPPYEIISSPRMSAEDLKQLKKTVKFLDIYYNSHRFDGSINFLSSKIKPSEIFSELAEKFEKENYDFKTFSASKQSDLLYAYGKEKLNKEENEKLEKLIYEDYVKSGNTRKWHKWIGE